MNAVSMGAPYRANKFSGRSKHSGAYDAYDIG